MKVLWSWVVLLLAGCSSMADGDYRYGVMIEPDDESFIIHSYAQQAQAVEITTKTADKHQYQPIASSTLAELELELWLKDPQQLCSVEEKNALVTHFKALSRSAGFSYSQPQRLQLYLSVNENFNYKERLAPDSDQLALFYSLRGCQQATEQLAEFYSHSVHELMHWLMLRHGLDFAQLNQVQHEYWASRGAYCALISNPGFQSLDPLYPSEFTPTELRLMQKKSGVENATELGARLLHNELNQLAGAQQVTKHHPEFQQILSWCRQKPELQATITD
jgi:hypothetical protein